MSYPVAVPVTATVTAVDGAPPESYDQGGQGQGQQQQQQAPHQGLSAAIAGFAGAAINLGATVFRETRDAYNNYDPSGDNRGTRNASSSSSFYRRMTRKDPPPNSTQYAYDSTELQNRVGANALRVGSAQDNIKQHAKCWCDFAAPLEPGCTSYTLKAACILPASIAYILGMLARVGDNFFVCICTPCIASTYGTYKMGETAANLTISATEILASGNQNNSRNAGAIIANRAAGQMENTQRELSAFTECIKCFDNWQKLNGLVLCPPCCGCCGVICSGGNPWPRSSYDLHGHCLEAPCQVCFMDIHVPVT